MMWLWQSTECCHTARIALHQDLTNCNKGEKEQSALPWTATAAVSNFYMKSEVTDVYITSSTYQWHKESCFVKNKTQKKSWEKEEKKIFHFGIFRSGLRHCQRNSLRHNKVLWQGTALLNYPCLMFSSVGFAVELQFCSYLCHIEVHRHTDCYLWGKSHFSPTANKVTILWLSAKWWRVRSQAAL